MQAHYDEGSNRYCLRIAKSITITLIKSIEMAVEWKRELSLAELREISNEGEKQSDGEEGRGSGGGEKARGKQHSLPPSLCSRGVSDTWQPF